MPASKQFTQFIALMELVEILAARQTTESLSLRSVGGEPVGRLTVEGGQVRFGVEHRGRVLVDEVFMREQPRLSVILRKILDRHSLARTERDLTWDISAIGRVSLCELTARALRKVAADCILPAAALRPPDTGLPQLRLLNVAFSPLELALAAGLWGNIRHEDVAVQLYFSPPVATSERWLFEWQPNDPGFAWPILTDQLGVRRVSDVRLFGTLGHLLMPSSSTRRLRSDRAATTALLVLLDEGICFVASSSRYMTLLVYDRTHIARLLTAYEEFIENDSARRPDGGGSVLLAGKVALAAGQHAATTVSGLRLAPPAYPGAPAASSSSSVSVAAPAAQPSGEGGRRASLAPRAPVQPAGAAGSAAPRPLAAPVPAAGKPPAPPSVTASVVVAAGLLPGSMGPVLDSLPARSASAETPVSVGGPAPPAASAETPPAAEAGWALGLPSPPAPSSVTVSSSSASAILALTTASPSPASSRTSDATPPSPRSVLPAAAAGASKSGTATKEGGGDDWVMAATELIDSTTWHAPTAGPSASSPWPSTGSPPAVTVPPAKPTATPVPPPSESLAIPRPPATEPPGELLTTALLAATLELGEGLPLPAPRLSTTSPVVEPAATAASVMTPPASHPPAGPVPTALPRVGEKDEPATVFGAPREWVSPARATLPPSAVTPEAVPEPPVASVASLVTVVPGAGLPVAEDSRPSGSAATAVVAMAAVAGAASASTPAPPVPPLSPTVWVVPEASTPQGLAAGPSALTPPAAVSSTVTPPAIDAPLPALLSQAGLPASEATALANDPTVAGVVQLGFPDLALLAALPVLETERTAGATAVPSLAESFAAQPDNGSAALVSDVLLLTAKDDQPTALAETCTETRTETQTETRTEPRADAQTEADAEPVLESRAAVGPKASAQQSAADVDADELNFRLEEWSPIRPLLRRDVPPEMMPDVLPDVLPDIELSTAPEAARETERETVKETRRSDFLDAVLLRTETMQNADGEPVGDGPTSERARAPWVSAMEEGESALQAARPAESAAEELDRLLDAQLMYAQRERETAGHQAGEAELAKSADPAALDRTRDEGVQTGGAATASWVSAEPLASPAVQEAPAADVSPASDGIELHEAAPTSADQATQSEAASLSLVSAVAVDADGPQAAAHEQGLPGSAVDASPRVPVISSGPVADWDSQTPLLVLDHFTARVDDRTVLKDLTFSVERRGVCAIMGPGGSGKSSLLGILGGHNRQSGGWTFSGSCLYEGQPLGAGLRPVTIPQTLHRTTLTIGDFLRSDAVEPVSEAQLQAVLQRVRLSRLCDSLHTEAGRLQPALGDGEWWRLVMARAILRNPPLLCIDEPTAGLSDAEAALIIDVLKAEGLRRTILFVTHNQQHARVISHRMMLLAGGRLQESETTEVFFSGPKSRAGQDYVRTGGCYVPSPDSSSEHLSEEFQAGPVLPPVAAPEPVPEVVAPAAAPPPVVRAEPAQDAEALWIDEASGKPLALSLRHFGLRVGTRMVLHDLNLDLPERGLFVLGIPDGMAKRMLVRALCGPRPRNFHMEGQARYGQAELSDDNSPMTPQAGAQLLMMSVAGYLGSALAERSLSRPEQRAETTRLITEAGFPELLQRLDRDMTSIEDAERRVLEILRAITGSPAVLVLDEPLAGLLPGPRERVIAVLKQQAGQRAVLILSQSAAIASDLQASHGWVLDGYTRTQAPPPPAPATEPAAPVAPSVESAPTVPEPAPPAPAAPPVAEPVAADAPLSRRFSGRGPRGFQWLRIGALAGMPAPGMTNDLAYDLDLIRSTGVAWLVTLTHEPLPADEVARHDLRNIQFPIVDMDVPTEEAAALLCARVAELVAGGQAVGFHCKAGLGRTGTMLACQLIWEGTPASAALRDVRAVEPGWIQSEKQVAFLSRFEEWLSHMWPMEGGQRKKRKTVPDAHPINSQGAQLPEKKEKSNDPT